MTQPQSDYAGLKSLAQALGRGLAILLMALLGTCVGGIVGGVSSFYCYFIGAYLGMPIGLVAGVIIGGKTSILDAMFIFGMGAVTWLGGWAAYQLIGPTELDAFFFGILAALSGVIVAVFALLGRQKVPKKVRLVLGLITSGIPTLMLVASWLRWIYG